MKTKENVRSSKICFNPIEMLKLDLQNSFDCHLLWAVPQKSIMNSTRTILEMRKVNRLSGPARERWLLSHTWMLNLFAVEGKRENLKEWRHVETAS